MVEFDLQIDGITGNVYDPDNVSLDMELKSSNGKTMRIIGFYFVPHTIEANKNVGGQSGNPSWRFRFTPLNEGTWDFTITLAEKGKTVDTISGYINVSPTADTRGFLSVEPIKKQVFTFEDGTLFVPVGENVAWYGVNSNAVYSYYDTVNQKLHANGANHVRTWLASWCLSIITGGRAPSDLSGGMQRAVMLDKIMESCAENEIYLSFCIYHHGMFSNGADPDWNGSPYNKNNNSNGYLNSPEQFFTDERAKKDCKLYIRYLIARYGYSRNILTWELINEIDQSNAKNLSDGGLQWHREMTAYIRSIDPYGHMVSTSAARNQNPIPFDDIFDFVQVHWYTYGDLHNLMNVQRNGYSRVHKPILFAEAGVFEGGNQIAMTSSTPVMVHQQHWIGVMGGGAGTGMTWYWEEFERYNCYYLFNGISAFSKRIPWADANRKDYTAIASNNGNIRIVGYTGNAYAYLWLYDNTYKHERQGSGITYSNITFKVNIEKAGTYQVEWIDTWTNTVIKTETLTTSNGTLHLNSPAWARDVAVAITTQ